MSAENPQINRLIIDTQPGETVRCQADGEITAIFEIPGNEMVVMIKHGSYRTVYGTLQNVSVNVGDLVAQNEKIGEVSIIDNGKMVFEIWHSTNDTNRTEKIEDWIELK